MIGAPLFPTFFLSSPLLPQKSFPQFFYSLLLSLFTILIQYDERRGMFIFPGRVEHILCLPWNLPTGSPLLNREKNNPVPRPAQTLSRVDPRHHVLTRQFIRSVTFTSARLVSSLVTLVGSCTFLHRLLMIRRASFSPIIQIPARARPYP